MNHTLTSSSPNLYRIPLLAPDKAPDIFAWAERGHEAYLKRTQELPVARDHTIHDWLRIAEEYLLQGARFEDGEWVACTRKWATPLETIEVKAHAYLLHGGLR